MKTFLEFVAFSCAVVFSIDCGCYIEKSVIQKDAIAHGAAHWEVDTNGVTSFVWNKPASK